MTLEGVVCPICGNNEFEQIYMQLYWDKNPIVPINSKMGLIPFIHRCTDCSYVLIFAPDRKSPTDTRKKSKPIQIDLDFDENANDD